jgi:ribosomal protein L29
MSDSDIRKTAEAKKSIEKELSQLIQKLNAGTIDRKKLDHGLRKARKEVARMPPHTG